MAHWKKHYSTEHLDASDIPKDSKITVKIMSVRTVTVEGEKGKESKALVQFEPGPAFGRQCAKRTWVAAKTCGYCLAAMFGDDVDGWIGKRVTLHSEKVNAFGDITDAVRVAGSPDIDRKITLRVRQGKNKATIVLVPTPVGKPSPDQTREEESAKEPVPSVPTPRETLISQITEQLRSGAIPTADVAAEALRAGGVEDVDAVMAGILGGGE